MFKYFESNDIARKILDEHNDKYYLKLSFWQDSDTTASLRLIMCTDDKWKMSDTKVLTLWTFDLLEDNPKDYVKEAQNLKARLKRKLRKRTITSDLRW